MEIPPISSAERKVERLWDENIELREEIKRLREKIELLEKQIVSIKGRNKEVKDDK